MKVETKSHIIASVGTLSALALLLALLFFLQIGVPQVYEDEGIEVAFGVVEDGGGFQPSREPAPQEEQVMSQPSAPSHPSDNDLLVQEDEEALQLAKQREEEARRIAQAEAERKAREAQEAAERERKQKAIARANAMGSLFGTSDEPTTGSGTGKGEEHKGNPTVGTAPLGESYYSLAGRGIVGTLPKPASNVQKEGVVVVNIQVDREGNVVSAVVGKGTDTGDYTLQQLAVAAAKKAKFTPTDQPTLQMGKITYTFKLK